MILFLCWGPLSPAHADSPRQKEKNLISLEVLGRGGYGSIQYDRTIFKNFSLGAGVGGVTATTYAVVRSLTSVTSTQFEPWYFLYANYYIAGEYISPFATAGGIYAPGNGKVDLTLWPGVGIEFRTHVGPTLRITFYLPKASPGDTFPGWPAIWTGLTLGYCF